VDENEVLESISPKTWATARVLEAGGDASLHGLKEALYLSVLSVRVRTRCDLMNTELFAGGCERAIGENTLIVTLNDGDAAAAVGEVVDHGAELAQVFGAAIVRPASEAGGEAGAIIDKALDIFFPVKTRWSRDLVPIGIDFAARAASGTTRRLASVRDGFVFGVRGVARHTVLRRIDTGARGPRPVFALFAGVFANLIRCVTRAQMKTKRVMCHVISVAGREHGVLQTRGELTENDCEALTMEDGDRSPVRESNIAAFARARLGFMEANKTVRLHQTSG
jgi:hypothetical protein